MSVERERQALLSGGHPQTGSLTFLDRATQETVEGSQLDALLWVRGSCIATRVCNFELPLSSSVPTTHCCSWCSTTARSHAAHRTTISARSVFGCTCRVLSCTVRSTRLSDGLGASCSSDVQPHAALAVGSGRCCTHSAHSSSVRAHQ
jgi:hypothetical protein